MSPGYREEHVSRFSLKDGPTVAWAQDCVGPGEPFEEGVE